MIPLPRRTPKEDHFDFFESDLYLLRKVFLPHADVVYILDPLQRVRQNWDTDLVFVQDRAALQSIGRRPAPYGLINLSKLPIRRHPFALKHLDAALSFYPYPTDDGLLPHQRTYYIIENPYKTIRWVIPHGMTTHHFNRLYAEDAAYPRLWRWMIRAAVALNKWRWITEARFVTYDRTGRILPFLDPDVAPPHSHFALFAGRMNITGRVLIPLYQEQETVAFVKLAVRSSAEEGLEREADALAEIKRRAPHGLVVPAVARRPGYSVLSPIFPSQSQPLHHLIPPVVQRWQEVQAGFDRGEAFAQWAHQWQWPEQIRRLMERARQGDVPSGVSPRNVELLAEQVQEVADRMMGRTFTFSLAHGDFSSRNVRWDGSSLYVVDWDRTRFDAPRFADFFNFLLEPFESQGETDPQPVLEAVEAFWTEQTFRWDAEEPRQWPPHFLVFLADRVLAYLAPLLDKRVVGHQVNLRFYLWRRLFDELLSHEP